MGTAASAPARVRGVVASLLLAAACAVALASPTEASTGSCDGVWVVVDARAAGGSLTTRCAPGDPSSGLAALESAGFSYAFVPRIPGFVCTIDGRPDPCNGAPAEAYWSYWHSPAGGSWTYSSAGAGNRDPAPGSVEGWRFGDGSAPPGIAPPANAPPPAPEPEPPTDSSDGPPTPTDGSDRDGGAEDPPSRGGGGDRSGSGANGARGGGDSSDDDSSAGSNGGASTAGADAADRTAPGSERPDATDRTPGGANGDGATGTDDTDGSSGEPPEVATGEWANPPPGDTTSSDPSGGSEDASRSPPSDPAPGGSTAEDSDRTPAGEQDLTLAARRRAGSSGFPVGAVVAFGLLAGIAGLTWRQRVVRSGPRP